MPKSLRCGLLEHRARTIVDALGGMWSRAGGMCCCPAHADRTPSLSITVGHRAILVHCFAGCTNAAVIQGLAEAGVQISDLFDGSGKAVTRAPREEIADRNALRLWSDALSLAGSPAALYLAGRAITTTSPDLRYHPRTPLGPKGSVRFLPALIAAVRNDTGVLALHRTFLDPASVGIAQFRCPKRALGSLGTGAVRLGMPRGGHLGIAEGIETALSAMQLFSIPCWATLGNNRFGVVTIPESVRKLHLFVDNDAGGVLADERAREAYACEGRRIATRCPGRSGADWNDELIRRSAIRA